MKDPITPNPEPTPGRGKWITLILLAALAALLYAGVMLKIANIGF